MFAGNVAAGDEIGDGITSSMTILYDLDATQLGTGPENNNSWDWNSNISTASSNYTAGQSMYYNHQGTNIENGDRSQKIMYQESQWSEAYSSVYQNNTYDQNSYNQYNYQHYDSSYIDSSKHVDLVQSSYDNFVVSNPNCNQHVKSASWVNTQFTPQQLAKGNNNSYQQHGLHQRNVLQSFGTTSSGANYKILPSKKFVVGNVVAREYPQLGQRGMLTSAFARKSLGGTYQGQPTPLLKNRLGQLGHGLIKIVTDSNLNTNKKPSLVFHDPPYQRQKPSYVQAPPPEFVEIDEARNNGAEKQFSPTAIELVSASTDDDEFDEETPSSPQVVVVKTVPIRNTIFGHKKLKFRCMRCGNRDATFNSQLTHVKSHRKPYCMQCCWIGDYALQLKAHVEKAHPKFDTGSGVTMVTSKYGRKCQVNTSVAVGLKKKKFPAKSPQKLVPNLADAEDEKPRLKVPLLLEIKSEVKVDDREELKEIKIERFSPVPNVEQTKGRVQSGTKLPAKLATLPTRELSKRRMVLMAKNAPKEEETPPLKDKFIVKEDESPPYKRKIVHKEDKTPQSKGKVDPEENGTPPPKGKIAFKGEETQHSKGKIVPNDTPSSKRNIALKVDGTPSPKGKIALIEGGTPPSKVTTAPRELREMPKRVLRKK